MGSMITAKYDTETDQIIGDSSMVNNGTPNGTTEPGGGVGGTPTNISIVTSATDVTVHSSTGSDGVIAAATTSVAGVMSATDKTKLNGIATGATVNATDAQLRDRNTHTGTQLASTISDFSTAADARIALASVNALADVTVSAPTVGQVLKWNGSAWVNDADATSGGAGATNLSVTTSSTTLTVNSDTGTDAVLPVATTTLSGVLSAADKTKLDGIAAGAAAVGSTAGAALGTAAAGVATTAARSDHVHAAPTTVSGNAGTATALQTARTISLSGDVTGSVSFNGTANVAITATVVDDSHLHSTSTISDFAPSVGAQIAASSIDALADVNTSGATAGKVLQFDGVNWLPATPAAGGSVTYDGVVFVSPTGNDGTAVVGDPSKPFARIDSAITGRGTALNFNIAPGTYDFGNGYMDLPVNSSFVCSNGRAKLLFSGTQHFNNEAADGRPAVNPAKGTGVVWMEGLDIEVGYNGVDLIAPIGIASYAGSILSTDVFPTIHLHKCTVKGVTDILYGITCKRFRIVTSQCEFYSNWDVCYLGSGCDFELNSTDVYWNIRRDTYNQGDSAFAINGTAKLSLLSGTFYVDCSVYNTTADRSTWRGIIGAPTQGSKVYVSAGFKRVNIATGAPTASPYRDHFIHSFQNVGTTSGCITIDSGALNNWLPCYGRNDSTPTKTGASLKVDGTFGFKLQSVATDVPVAWSLDAAAATMTVPLFVLPAGCYIKRCSLAVVTAMGGTPTAATIEVGIAGNTAKYLPATSIKTAATQATLESAAAMEAISNPFTSAGTAIIATVRTTGGNVNTGSGAQIYIMIETGGGGGFAVA